jgi:hypothetical protein
MPHVQKRLMPSPFEGLRSGRFRFAHGVSRFGGIYEGYMHDIFVAY